MKEQCLISRCKKKGDHVESSSHDCTNLLLKSFQLHRPIKLISVGLLVLQQTCPAKQSYRLTLESRLVA